MSQRRSAETCIRILNKTTLSHSKIYRDHHHNTVVHPGAAPPQPILTHPISANSTERKREATGQMMYLSSGVDMASLPACVWCVCVCVLGGEKKGGGGCRVTVRELEKGE